VCSRKNRRRCLRWTVDAVFMCDLAVTINGATHQIQSVLSLTPDRSCSFRTAQLMLVRDHAAMPPISSYHYYYYFASAAVAVDSSHMTASSSTSWSRFSSPSTFVNGEVSTMWLTTTQRDRQTDRQLWSHRQTDTDVREAGCSIVVSMTTRRPPRAPV